MSWQLCSLRSSLSSVSGDSLLLLRPEVTRFLSITILLASSSERHFAHHVAQSLSLAARNLFTMMSVEKFSMCDSQFAIHFFISPFSKVKHLRSLFWSADA